MWGCRGEDGCAAEGGWEWDGSGSERVCRGRCRCRCRGGGGRKEGGASHGPLLPLAQKLQQELLLQDRVLLRLMAGVLAGVKSGLLWWLCWAGAVWVVRVVGGRGCELRVVVYLL